MNKSDAQTTPHDGLGPSGWVRSEIGRLLQQRAGLAESEKSAAIEEKTRRVAHEIRNPLAAIQAVCSTLLLEIDDPEQRRGIKMISGQVEKIAAALSDAVDNRGEPHDPPQPVDVGETIRSLVDLVRYQLPEDLELETELAPDLVCSVPERGLTRSLYQLLRRSVESLAGRHDGRICLRCTRDDASLRIEVADNGPGLPAALVDQGLHALAAQDSDLALELNAISRLVRSRGGEIRFANPEGGGAAVLLSLPLAPPPPDSP